MRSVLITSLFIYSKERLKYFSSTKLYIICVVLASQHFWYLLLEVPWSPLLPERVLHHVIPDGISLSVILGSATCLGDKMTCCYAANFSAFFWLWVFKYLVDLASRISNANSKYVERKKTILNFCIDWTRNICTKYFKPPQMVVVRELCTFFD